VEIAGVEPHKIVSPGPKNVSRDINDGRLTRIIRSHQDIQALPQRQG
jgi:hypothetical protein